MKPQYVLCMLSVPPTESFTLSHSEIGAVRLWALGQCLMEVIEFFMLLSVVH